MIAQKVRGDRAGRPPLGEVLPPVAAPRVQRFDAVTADRDEIDHLTQVMFGAGVRFASSDGRVPSLRLAQASVGGLGVQRVTWNVDGRFAAGLSDRFVGIRMRRGGAGLDQGAGRTCYTAGDAFLVNPERPRDAEVVGADLDAVTLDRDTVAAVVAQIAPWSQGRLDHRHAHPVTEQLEQAWDDAVDDVVRALRADDLLAEHDLIRAAMLHRVVATACAAFALIPERGREATASARAVRRARSYVDDHVADPITPGDVAAAVGVSLRSLQAAFRRELATTPFAYLRRARLHAARAELTAARDTTTVAEVARRWGFAHLGRFSDTYRREFDELPSTTLRS